MTPKPPDILRKAHRHTDGKDRAAEKEDLRREIWGETIETRQRYLGTCHCGAIGYAYYTDEPSAAWSVRACQCSFCRRHGAVSTSDPAGAVELRIKQPAELNRYRFGLKTADFLICRRCGTYIAAVVATPSGDRASVNLNALEDTPRDLPLAEPVDYDGEASPEERLRRREARWTPLTQGKG
jgi:hypothetical protein